jgi:hypothetical protein
VFAGFTTATTNGALGSRQALHAFCAAQFPTAHACHGVELLNANLAATVPAVGVWVDSSGINENGSEYVRQDLASPRSGRYTGASTSWNCSNWTSLTWMSGVSTYPTNGLILTPAGYTSGVCNVARQVACCSTPFQEKFRGLTAALTGDLAGAGRTAAHSTCASAFPGSHFCHGTELTRTHLAITLPSGGVWVDSSGYFNSGSEYLRHDVASTQDSGRYAAASTSWNCSNWTALTWMSGVSTYPTNGLILTSAGYTSGQCNTARPLACCQ